MAATSRTFMRVHRIIALAVGVQMLFWVASGLFFTLWPIETVRGDHLHIDPFEAGLVGEVEGIVPFAQVADRPRGTPQSVTLKPYLDGPVYDVIASNGRALYDAGSGVRISPISEAMARRLAERSWDGDGELAELDLIETPPRESGSKTPVWRARYQGGDPATLWISADSGEITAVRTRLWRSFDLLWGLHIMDWTNRETFTTWWMKLFAAGALFVVMTGLVLLGLRLKRGRFFS